MNVPDIIEIHGIYETSDVDLTDANFGSPEMTLTQLNGPSASTGDMIIGEVDCWTNKWCSCSICRNKRCNHSQISS